MRNCLRITSILLLAVCFSIAAIAQNSVTVSGSVKNGKSNEIAPAVSITIKGTNSGTYTDDNGNFKITTTKKLPITLVISSVGFATKEVVVAKADEAVNISVEPSFDLGQEVVVAASRTPERILESPVTIERISGATIRNSPAASYYDVIGGLKGVDILTSSQTFKTPSTRGFQGSGNLRFNQLIDGMDNQAPGLNFSVGSVIGLTELDVESLELLAGASSALYGSGGMNGTLLINSKNPFKYQGFSFQIKQGATHIDNYQRTLSPYYDWSFRWAKKINEKLAFKVGAQFVQTRDWLGNDDRNYNRTTSANPNGEVKAGNRMSDPNYDGVNFYGDETTANLNTTAATILSQIPGAALGALNGIITANPNIPLGTFTSIISGNPSLAPLTQFAPIIYGAHPTKNYFVGQNVSRTGYAERDVVNPNTLNVKGSFALHYKIRENIEASLMSFFGVGNTVYTGSDRYSLINLKMAQHKLEIKGKDWFLRAYTTQENSGDSYNATITTRLFNERWKASSSWYPQYMAAYATAIAGGAPATTAHNGARGFADVGRPTGDIYKNSLFNTVAGTPIRNGGGLFVDRSDLYVGEGQYNLTNLLKLADKGTDILVGASYKEYWLDSRGTLFADTTGRIRIREKGAYAQIQQKLFNDLLKLSVSGRYDKNDNFEGRFTPRVSAVIKVAKDHNVRLSYQTAYRFPSTQNQWINLVVGGGTYLIGGLPQLRDFYKFSTNPVYSQANVGQYGAAFLGSLASQGVTNPAQATPAQLATAFGASQGILKPYVFGEFKPEICNSYEIGYKGQWFNKIVVDMYAYQANYQNFIGGINVLQSRLTGVTAPLGLLDASTRNVYATSINSQADVKIQGWGASMEYKMAKNFSFLANLFSDEIKDAPTGFITYFNAPKYRYNLGLSNAGFGKSKRYGFNIMYRWQDEFLYEGTFGQGIVPAFNTVDAMISYRFPELKSIVKFGGTNILNKYYRSGWGNPQVGALYYVSFGYNVF